ncbi:MAG: hypothetical protein HY302_03515, partial [Opitutae bacterium]|nr:hypothetical protein [Opitutae bacterium]
ALAALALTLPVLAGWAMLAWETRTRANAGYDAYKLLAVFYPGLLAGLAGWLAAARHASTRGQRVAGLCAAAVLAGNLLVAGEARRELMHAPLQVTRQLREVARLERDPRVASLNLLVDDFWSRLWANAFLLRKPQYFPTHTYEGRRNTPLRGQWDLRDTPLRTLPFAAEDFIIVNGRFDAVRVGAAGRVQAEFAADGWRQEETDGHEHWRWTAERGRVWVRNNTGRPIVASLRLRVLGVTPRTLRLVRDGTVLGAAKLGATVQEVVLPELELPAGISPLDLETVEPPVLPPGGNDPRRLSVALYGFELRARRFR